MNRCFNLDYKIFNPKRVPLQIRYKGGISYELHDNWDDRGERVYIEFRIDGVDVRKLRVNPEEALTNFDRTVMTSLKARIDDLIKSHPHDDLMLANQNIFFVVNITNQELGRKNSVHSELLGFTLYLGKFDREVHALNTPSEALDNIADTANVSNSVNASIKLIDPERRFSNLWTNVFGRAVKVDAVRVSDQTPGLYLFCEGEDVDGIQCYFTFDEIDNKILQQYGIFMSEQDALLGGNTDELIRTRKSLDNVKKENRDLMTMLSTQRTRIGELIQRVATVTNEVAVLKAEVTKKDLEQKFFEKLEKKKAGMDTLGGYVKNASIVCSALLSIYKTVT
jgi:hypothetical protein